MAKKSKSPIVQRAEELNKAPGNYKLTAEEQEQYSRIVKAILDARRQRDMQRDEFDGLTYDQVYLSNKRAAMSYLQPKRNDDEVRINTGTTEKRIELVHNELLGLNLEGEVKTFDKDDNLLVELGEVFTDIVLRTEEIEEARDKDIYFYRELLTQPSVFVEDLWINESRNDQRRKKLASRYRCDRRLLQGPQIYLGDINLPDIRFNEQPFLVKYARMSYEEGERLFKDMNPERWKFVVPGAYQTLGALPPSYKLYRDGSLYQNEIEAYWYMSYPDNEVQIFVAGMPWLEVGTKYTDEFGDLKGYHITMVGLNPYGYDFAYSKPLTQSAKTLQALDNETIRNLIRKFRQALEPPMGIPKGRMFTRDIWNPGAMIQGVKKDDFEKLVDHGGVTRSEMGMFDLIEKKVNEFIGTSQTEPLQGKTQVTATELTLAQKNAIKMLGNSVLAAMRLKQRLTMLRNRMILANYTKPTGKEVDPITKKLTDIYARFSLNNVDVFGQNGTRTVQLMDRPTTKEEEKQIFDAEEGAKKAGQPFRYRTLNVKALEDMDLYFYVSVAAKERESTQVDKAILTDMINQAMVISKVTGRQIKGDKIVQKFENTWKEKGLFEKAPPPQPMGMSPEAMEVEGSPMAGKINVPSINEAPGTGNII